VLSAVSSEINCVFLHLLENPTLCDIEHRNTETGTAADPPGHRLAIGAIGAFVGALIGAFVGALVVYRNTATGMTAYLPGHRLDLD
jgi:hypothetical protein